VLALLALAVFACVVIGVAAMTIPARTGLSVKNVRLIGAKESVGYGFEAVPCPKACSPKAGIRRILLTFAAWSQHQCPPN
jgi:hypothetical protein